MIFGNGFNNSISINYSYSALVVNIQYSLASLGNTLKLPNFNKSVSLLLELNLNRVLGIIWYTLGLYKIYTLNKLINSIALISLLFNALAAVKLTIFIYFIIFKLPNSG